MLAVSLLLSERGSATKTKESQSCAEASKGNKVALPHMGKERGKEYFEKGGILEEEQQQFALKDLVCGEHIPFTNVLDQGCKEATDSTTHFQTKRSKIQHQPLFSLYSSICQTHVGINTIGSNIELILIKL